jgi:hypothetical protein
VAPVQPIIRLAPGILSLRVKRPGREADHSSPSSAEVRLNGATPPLPPHDFMDQTNDNSVFILFHIPQTTKMVTMLIFPQIIQHPLANRVFATCIQFCQTAVAQWLRYCATNRKVVGSIPDGVIGIYH